MNDAPGDGQRLDRWLWFARFFKSRSLAAKLCTGQRIRINRRIVNKPSATVRVGDVLTFPQGKRIRVVRILALAERRGPAPEAQALYDDLTPAAAPRAAGARAEAPVREQGAGRPTKRDRRALERLQQGADGASGDG